MCVLNEINSHKNESIVDNLANDIDDDIIETIIKDCDLMSLSKIGHVCDELPDWIGDDDNIEYDEEYNY